MAKYRFRGALNAAMFPFLSSLQSRTVIQPQLDNNVRTTQAFYGTAESADYSIPQLMFCENVLPTAEGLMSVGYETIIEGLPGAADFDQAITLRDADENNFLFCPAGGLNYIYTANSGTWTSTNPISAEGAAVSRAYVNGRTFICYDGLGVYEYDTALGTFNKLTLIGLTDADVHCIGASSNYLIAATDITVYWSSLVNPLDFTPSITTGAGYSIPQDVKAKITAIVGTAGGFLVYTAKNTVAAVYTNNIRAPFTFKEVSNAGGLESYEQTTSDQNSGPQYAWTTGGMQKITPQGSEPVSAEIDDFFAGKLYETFDSVSKLITVNTITDTEFSVKVTYVGSRFLVISYGVDSSGLFQYALVLDTTLKRWGKLKITHVDCFNYPYPNLFGDLSYDDLEDVSYDDLGDASYDDLAHGLTSKQPSKKTLAFLGADGQVQLALMNYDKSDENGVVIFGKFQLVRARMLTCQLLELEGIWGTGDSLVTLLASLDGKNLDQAVPMQVLRETQNYKKYAKRLTGLNLGILIEGAFALSSYLMEVTADGDR